MKIYVAGPMSGYADHNYPLFNRVTQYLRDMGHEVTNPVEINPDPAPYGKLVVPGDETWKQFMRNDINGLMWCDSICMLPGWERSRGATCENAVAYAFGHRMFNWDDLKCR